jgi:hypothetical protein
MNSGKFVLVGVVGRIDVAGVGLGIPCVAVRVVGVAGDDAIGG